MSDDSLFSDDSIYEFESSESDSAPESDASESDLNGGHDSDSDSIFGPSVPILPGFEDPDLGEALAEASQATLDDAPYGIVEVDSSGEVLFYNETESEFAGFDPEEVMGRNFFTSVAPCSNNRHFYGRFRENRRESVFDEQFSYTLTYRVSPTLVEVRLLRHSGQTWVLINLPEEFYSV